MNKKIVTWAVAALFAVPAIPMFAKTVHSHKLIHTSKVHAKTLVTSKKHRTSHHHKKHHTTVTAKKGHTTLATSAHAGRHMSTSSRHIVAKAAASTHPEVMIHNQPTIDGMHT